MHVANIGYHLREELTGIAERYESSRNMYASAVVGEMRRILDAGEGGDGGDYPERAVAAANFYRGATGRDPFPCFPEQRGYEEGQRVRDDNRTHWPPPPEDEEKRREERVTRAFFDLLESIPAEATVCPS